MFLKQLQPQFFTQSIICDIITGLEQALGVNWGHMGSGAGVVEITPSMCVLLQTGSVEGSDLKTNRKLN